jgi:hypothetical protein
VEKTKPEYANHFTYKPIIIFFFSANLKKKQIKVDSRVWFWRRRRRIGEKQVWIQQKKI